MLFRSSCNSGNSGPFSRRLGKSSLVSQLDNVLHTSGTYRAPDFLVVAHYEGRDVPCLVEIKTDAKDTLKWTDKYMRSLRAYADLVKLPFLVAWKRHGLWALVDSGRFMKKVTHIT